MVTNLPEKAKAQWSKVVLAKTPKEKLLELQKFYSMIPKHKGTKNLVKHVRKKIAALKEELEMERRRVRGARFVSSWNLKVHGVARISLASFSLEEEVKLFEYLSGRKVNKRFIFEPEYGVFGGKLQFQLVLLPRLEAHSKMISKVLSYLPSSKIVFFVSDQRDFSDFEDFNRIAESEGLILREVKGRVDIKRLSSGGIRVVGSLTDASNEELVKFLKSYGLRNAVVKISGEASIDDVENEVLGLKSYVPCVPVKFIDHSIALRENGGIKLIKDKDELFEYVLRKLSLIRVYTKSPQGEPSEKPIVLKEKSTVGDLAGKIHSRLLRHFRYAVVLRNGRPIKVSKNFRLMDGDIVEVRAY